MKREGARARNVIYARIRRKEEGEREKKDGRDKRRIEGGFLCRLMAARTKMFNANEHNGIFAGTGGNKSGR